MAENRNSMLPVLNVGTRCLSVKLMRRRNNEIREFNVGNNSWWNPWNDVAIRFGS